MVLQVEIDRHIMSRVLPGTGLFPGVDPWGRVFDATYEPERSRKAGLPLAGGWRGCLSGVQADQEYLRKLFKLKRG